LPWLRPIFSFFFFPGPAHRPFSRTRPPPWSRHSPAPRCLTRRCHARVLSPAGPPTSLPPLRRTVPGPLLSSSSTCRAGSSSSHSSAFFAIARVELSAVAHLTTSPPSPSSQKGARRPPSAPSEHLPLPRCGEQCNRKNYLSIHRLR
jgi:hypothetical protein